VLFTAGFVALFLVLWLVFLAGGPAMQRGLAWSAHFTASFRYRDYLPVFVVLAVGAALTALAGDQFLDLAELVQGRSPQLHAADQAAHTWARENRQFGSTLFFEVMTRIGSPITLGLIAATVGIPLLSKGRWKWAAYLGFTCVAGGVLNLELKRFFARARPDLAEALRDAHGYSFPSGHAMGSTVVFGALAYLAMRILPRWRYRAAALSAAVTLTLAISTSRVYLGVHWISDVGAGIAAGLLWLTTTTVAYETFRRIRMVRSLRKRADDAGRRLAPPHS
jgi:membrane-associated phospholipid phosphatase